MSNARPLLEAKVKQAEASVSRLEAAIRELEADGSADQAHNLGVQLSIAEAKLDAARKKLEAFDTDQAREVEEAVAEDRAGLLRLYEERGGKLSDLPRALQTRIREAVREAGEQRLLQNRGAGLPGH